MDAVEILEAIARGEDSRLQFKRDLTNPDQTAAEIAAFANSLGGTLIIGVDDDKQTVIGVSQEDIRRLNGLISNASSQGINEPVYPTSEVVTVEGKLVLVVQVRQSDGKPHFDRNGAVWVKTVGDKRRVTAREELRRLFQEVDALHADELPIRGSTENDLNLAAFDEYYVRQFGHSFKGEKLDLNRILNSVNLARGTELNLAGLLLFGQEPQRFRPSFVVTAASFAGNDPAGTNYLDTETLSGSLPILFSKSLSFLRRNLKQVQSVGINILDSAV